MQTLLVLAAAWTVKDIVTITVIGLVAGLLARAILPGRQHLGLILTIVLGVAGAWVGAFIQGWTKVGGDTLMWQVIFATGGALLLLILLSLFGVFKK